MRRKLIDLMNQRTTQVTAAEAALQAGNQEEYNSAMTKVRNMNAEIQNLQDLIQEQDRRFAPATSAAEQRDMAEERGRQLANREAVTFSAAEVRQVLNSTTLASGNIVEPTGAGSDIRDPLGNVVSSIVDQVSVIDLTGMGAYQEPYVISELEAVGGTIEDTAGKARTESVDPSFGIAEIRPYELSVTTFVDRNISRLSPANYYAKIYNMAMRAMRRKLATMIVNGDGAASPVFYGITTAKNKAGDNIFATQSLSAIDVQTLDTMYFTYGSDEAIGANARMLMTKANLKAFGALRGTNEKRRLLEITPDMGNPNVGTMRDGGVVVPYTLQNDVGATKLLYGDPRNYELGLFGGYTIRVDESVKAVERMIAILGDVTVGGNLVVDKGFVVGTIGG